MQNKLSELIKNYKYLVIDSANIKNDRLIDIADKDYFLLIVNGNIITPENKIEKQDILIYKDKIIATDSNIPDKLPENVQGAKIIDAKGCIITPGLVDQHIHGGYGCDFNSSSAEEIINLTKNLPEHGITAILPTIMTAPKETIKKQIEQIKLAKENLPENSTKLLGIHLEGPYLSAKYKGIHPESELLNPDIEHFKTIEDPEIKIVTYAPELDKNYEFTKYLHSKNIIPSAGHTNATLDEIKIAGNFGLKQVTHLFNAMVHLHHRNPGIISEALTNDDIYVEIIADEIHLNPCIIDIVLRSKPESKVIFISDSLPLNQANFDSMEFGNQMISKKDAQAVNKDGTLAGSLLFLDGCLRKLSKNTSFDLSKFIKGSSSNVYQNLNINNAGYIDKDNSADIVLWNPENDYQVMMTIINGQIAFQSENLA